MNARGFTLLEVLIAIAILALVAMICFASVNTVVNSVEAARVSAAEMRQRQFLQRYFARNFSAAYYDHKELDPNQVLLSLGQREVLFEGVDDSGGDGPMDAVTFWSTAGPTGGIGLPGEVKQVVIEAVRGEGEDETDPGAVAEPSEEEDSSGLKPNTLRIIETAWLSGAGDGSDPGSLGAGSGLLDAEPDEGQSGVWEVPIESFDVAYYDSRDWIDAWNWQEQRRMLPWAVRIRINFAKSEALRDYEREQGIDRGDHPDFEQVVLLRMGAGTLLTPEELAEVTINEQEGGESPFPSFPLLQAERDLAYPQATGAPGADGQQLDGASEDTQPEGSESSPEEPGATPPNEDAPQPFERGEEPAEESDLEDDA